MGIAISKEKVQAQHGIMMIYSFFTLLLTNIIVLMVANALFPAQVVLGTASIPYIWAICHSMLRLSVVATFVMPLVTYYEWKKSMTFTPKQWMITYLFVNIVALWVISRFADNLGLGLSSWVVVILLAAAFDWVQGLAMMALGKFVKMN